MEKINKGWGYELWIVNKKEYCGKLLHFFKGTKCSYHYHLLKDETFYLQSGRILLKYGFGELETAQEITLTPGMNFHIPIGLRHQMIALEESDLFEFSTEHFEEDSYRIVKGD
jgi:quercetin dioxygenase-like cupin family protein